jgi:hypothetical protein
MKGRVSTLVVSTRTTRSLPLGPSPTGGREAELRPTGRQARARARAPAGAQPAGGAASSRRRSGEQSQEIEARRNSTKVAPRARLLVRVGGLSLA